jgi:dienelactone hydrolase
VGIAWAVTISKQSRVLTTLVVAVLAGCALLVWRLVSRADEAGGYAVCQSQAAGLRLWYPAASAAPLAQLASRLTLQPECADAAIAAHPQPFPVLLYFGGWPGVEVNNLELINSLVRAGFVVATPLEFPGGPEAPMSFASESAYRDTLSRADARVRLMGVAARSAVDRLVALANGEPHTQFAGRLDSGRIGIWGYSFGGAIAAQAAWLDPRIRSAVNIDGWSFGDAAIHGVHQPYLIVSDDSPAPGPADLASSDPVRRYTSMLTRDDVARLLHNFSVNGGYFVTVAGTEHADFYDRSRRSRLREMLGAGRDRAGRVQELLRAYVLAFFRNTLEGVRSPLLEGSAEEFPEARLQRWEGTLDGKR